MHLKWRLSHIRGYLELGLLDAAAAELATIPEREHGDVAVVQMRMAVSQERGDWPTLQAAASEFARRCPDDASGWIMWAYATRRADSLCAAEGILRQAEKLHERNAVIQFNLGCYACQRGDLLEARLRVDRAIEIDPEFRSAAATDPDLAPLRAAASRR